MKLTLKHYGRFGVFKGVGGNLVQPQSWDAVRMDNHTDNPFGLPSDRQEWQNKAESNAALNRRAGMIADLMRTNGYNTIYSFGVGGAGLEFLLKQRLPQVMIKCSDYAPQTVAVLRRLFTEADAIDCFDMVSGIFPAPQGRCLYVLHRVDTEFSDDQWRGIFERLNAAQAQDILFIPNALATISDIVKESAKALLKPLIKGIAFAGYIRTEQRFMELWQAGYGLRAEMVCGDLKGFWLHRKDRQ